MASPASSLGPSQRIQQRLAQALAGLPPRLQVRLSGREPVTLDGDTLAPDIQLMLSLMERRGVPPLETLSPPQARTMRRRLAAIFGGRPIAVGPVSDIELDTAASGGPVALRARHYAPAESGGPHPLLVFFHGGGFLYGDLDTHDPVCRVLCRHGGAHVLAVEYRLAPEHRFPAAVEDARAALRWAQARAPRLGADPARVGVGGDSAGGNLAAVAAQLAAHDGGPPPAVQLLIYPPTDSTTRRPSRELFGEGFLLTRSQMDWFEENYLGEEHAHTRDPRASPLLAEDLSGLAPALVVTAAFDPLRDEGEDYARALLAAGTPATLRRFPGMTHAFVSFAGVSRGCRDALVEIAGAMRAMFATAGLPPARGEDPEPALAALNAR
jgi:acetyl esterase/lipase